MPSYSDRVMSCQRKLPGGMQETCPPICSSFCPCASWLAQPLPLLSLHLGHLEVCQDGGLLEKIKRFDNFLDITENVRIGPTNSNFGQNNTGPAFNAILHLHIHFLCIYGKIILWIISSCSEFVFPGHSLIRFEKNKTIFTKQYNAPILYRVSIKQTIQLTQFSLSFLS